MDTTPKKIKTETEIINIFSILYVKKLFDQRTKKMENETNLFIIKKHIDHGKKLVKNLKILEEKNQIKKGTTETFQAQLELIIEQLKKKEEQ